MTVLNNIKTLSALKRTVYEILEDSSGRRQKGRH